MKAIFLLMLLSGLAFGIEPNEWTMTCTDTGAKESVPSETATSNPCNDTTLTALAPTLRANRTPLTLKELAGCTVYLGGYPVRMLPAVTDLTYTHPGDPSKCPVIPPAMVPTNGTATKVSGGYRVDCNLPAGSVQVRMLIVNVNDSLGARVATAKVCGFVLASYSLARQYTLKAVSGTGVLSGRSALLVIK